MIWYKNKPEVLKELINQLSINYPTLHVVIICNVVHISGSLLLNDPASGREFDRFGIDIILPENYPNQIPKVRETEDRIPKTIFRHFMSDGSACLFFRDEQYKYYNKNTKIIDFIRIPVYNFFLSQSYFELTEKWIFGERPHGKGATWDFYSEELGVYDINTIGRFLVMLASEKLDILHKCYCGSNKQLINCHINKVVQMRKNIPRNDALFSLKEISEINEGLKEVLKRRVK
jgi:hypothetical protein